ncbi:MAG: PAS domain-containing protein [Hyphomicrobiales bacterium]|nr:PAS domain-containing protein [Hyphomicrobiales bacterium]
MARRHSVFQNSGLNKDLTSQFLDDETWSLVLAAVDKTYAELVAHQMKLEKQNNELEELRAFLFSILQSVSDVLVVVSRTGNVEECSQSLCDLTHMPKARLVNGRFEKLFAEGSRDDLETASKRVHATREATHLEADLITPAGPMLLDLSISPLFDDRARVAGFVLTGRPLGELRKAYEQLETSHSELKAAQAQIVRNEKLASLGRLLAGVAHELNNPISFVYANTHALERYVGKFETYFGEVQRGADRETLIALRDTLKLDRDVKNLRTAMEGARDGAERVRDIVEDLRRLSSDGSGSVMKFDLAETTRIATDWVRRGSRQGTRVIFEQGSPVFCTGRAGHIQQIIMNLVQNAMDAVHGQADPCVRLTLCETDRVITLDVDDNGPGIEGGKSAAIFDPFYTTKEVGQGTGLGLAISHKIAVEHGGSLRLAESTLGGACFRLELPKVSGMQSGDNFDGRQE